MSEPIREAGLGWPADVPRGTSVDLPGREAGLGWPVASSTSADDEAAA